MSGNVDESASRVITRDAKFFLGTDSSIYLVELWRMQDPAHFIGFQVFSKRRNYSVCPVVIPPIRAVVIGLLTTSGVASMALYVDYVEMELPSNESYVDVTRNGYHILTSI